MHTYLNKDDAEKIAKKLGADVTEGRKHQHAVFRYKGKEVASFGISRGHKEKGHNYIPRQLYLSNHQCMEFKQCTLELDEYLEILRSQGLI